MKYRLLISAVCMFLSITLSAQIGTGESVTYDAYMQRVLEYSLHIKQTTAQRTALQQAVKAAKTAFYPAVDAAGTYQYRINNYNMAFGPVSMPMEHDSYSVEAGFTQPVYAGGSIYHQYKATQVQSEIAGKSVDLTTDNVIHAAAMSYWGASAQKEMYEVMGQYVDIIKALDNVLTDRYKDGLISKTDLLQVKARLKDAEFQKVTSYKSYQIALQNLNVLMGREPMNAVGIEDSISMAQQMPKQVGLDMALSNRPEYSISRLNIDYQKRQIELAKSKYNPSVAIGFKESWGTQMLNLNGETMFNSNVFASVQIPIFRWGARYKTTASQKAILLGKQFEMDNTKDQIMQEVCKAWTNLTENNRQIEIARANCEIAEESLDLNTFSYNEGKLTILDVLSAQLTWIQSYSNLIQTWYQQKISLADYQKAVGWRYLDK